MKRVGLIGWRGMVGQVLLERMLEEGDFAHFEAAFFSASEDFPASVSVGNVDYPLLNGFDLAELKALDVILSCRGSDYTRKVHPRLRGEGWKGLWIDAASFLRMEESTCLLLDPVNLERIQSAKREGIRDYAGANCTVSLMLMALAGLFKREMIGWISSATYQAASGAGAHQLLELVQQMNYLSADLPAERSLPQTILQIERKVAKKMLAEDLPRQELGVALAGSLIPWIDDLAEGGQTREEWKGMAESRKLTGLSIPIDGTCVRVGTLRCHAQALTLKLTRDFPLDEIEEAIASAHPWVKLVPNRREETLHQFSPARVGGTLAIPVGRLRKSTLGSEYLQMFTLGDQLLWGAAEPLRRTLRLFLQEA